MMIGGMSNKIIPWYQRLWGEVVRSSRWLIPGLGVKRWLLVTLTGTTLIGVGLAILTLDIYRTTPETWWLPLLSYTSLRFIARPLRVVIFGGLGLALIFLGIWGVNRSVLKPFLRPGRPVVDTLTQHRRRERGPRVVVIGGGHGLSTMLRGLKEFTHSITAVVTVADDGGSSGRLRQEMGILPPGDIRNCLAALSNDEALLTQLFQYRFPDGREDLEGHSFGNLFISALAEITGSFEEAVVESGRVLAVHGRVLPSTLHEVRLSADIMLPHLVSEVRVEGESHIPEVSGRVRRIWLEPNNPPAFPQVVQAILAADLVVIGPGSLYTSILPNLLVPDITQALRRTRALKVYICNIATQPGETDNYTVADHVAAIVVHTALECIDVVLANSNFPTLPPEDVQTQLVQVGEMVDERLHTADLVDESKPWRHDSDKVATAVLALLKK